MKIIGFGQVMRFDRVPSMQHEIKVIMPDGREVSVPTDESTVQALINLWGTEQLGEVMPEKSVPAVYSELHSEEFGTAPSRPPLTVVTDDMGYPVVAQPSTPKFLRDEDEDGQQI